MKFLFHCSLFTVHCSLLLFTAVAYSQNNFTINGYVKDAKTGEELIGAAVIIKELPETGAITNAYGFYSITVPKGEYTITAQYLGFQSLVNKVNLTQNRKQDFALTEKSNELKEIEISGEKNNDNVTNTTPGIQKMDIKEIQSIPVIFGEKDVLKTLQLLPGVKSAGEGNSGFYVRGGAADQNLILLDEANVYNASHLMGFFSVFNSDAIKDVTLYKGSIPAEFGGRLASVLDIRMNDGNDKQYVVNGGIGLISSRLSVEGPIVKNNGSFIISARRTYADLFLKLSRDTTLNKSTLYFYDVNMKANYRIDSNNRVYLSGYFGTDVLGFSNTFGLDWGNITGTVRWNHLYSEKLFSNTSLIFSNYDYKIMTNEGNNQYHILSRIQDYEIKQDFQYFPSTRNSIDFGFISIYHRIIPGIITSASTINAINTKLNNKYAWDNAIYVSDEFKATSKFSVYYGLRLTSFTLLGPGVFYTYNPDGSYADSSKFGNNKFVKTYLNLEPRLSFNYLLNQESSVKASYARTTQNLHLLSNSTSGNPTDLWIPSSNNVKPEIADQYSLGYFRNFKDNLFEFSTEVYYKNMFNQIDYVNGAQLNFNQKVESQLLFGTGRAYGIELFVKKKYGKFNGWIGYTLSRTERQFDEINNGAWFPAKQDITHDVSIVGIYELNKKWTFSATWVYNTGNAVTFPSGKYEAADEIVNLYTSHNGYRMPAYHRLDIGATWQRKKTAKFESSWTFSVYNVYDRWNAYSITFKQDPNDLSKTQAVQTTLFGIIPSVSYNFKF